MRIKSEDEKNIQICDLTDSASFKECQTCALGALMLSEIRHTNKLALSDVLLNHCEKLDKFVKDIKEKGLVLEFYSL